MVILATQCDYFYSDVSCRAIWPKTWTNSRGAPKILFNKCHVSSTGIELLFWESFV